MKTVLVVDDEYALVETLHALLQEMGYRVVTAANGKAGLEQLKNEKPDLVLTDFMMPMADGRELVLGIRALPEFQSTPVVMMSATHREVALSSYRNTAPLKLAGFLTKPFRFQELIDIIERLIGKGEPPNPS